MNELRRRRQTDSSSALSVCPVDEAFQALAEFFDRRVADRLGLMGRGSSHPRGAGHTLVVMLELRWKNDLRPYGLAVRSAR